MQDTYKQFVKKKKSIDIQTTFFYSHVIAKTLKVTTQMNVGFRQSCHGNKENHELGMILTSSLLRKPKKMYTVYNTGGLPPLHRQCSVVLPLHRRCSVVPRALCGLSEVPSLHLWHNEVPPLHRRFSEMPSPIRRASAVASPVRYDNQQVHAVSPVPSTSKNRSVLLRRSKAATPLRSTVTHSGTASNRADPVSTPPRATVTATDYPGVDPSTDVRQQIADLFAYVKRRFDDVENTLQAHSATLNKEISVIRKTVLMTDVVVNRIRAAVCADEGRNRQHGAKVG